jgi:hypothetical protein
MPTKPLFPQPHSIGLVFAARYAHSVGRGIRGVPRLMLGRRQARREGE